MCATRYCATSPYVLATSSTKRRRSRYRSPMLPSTTFPRGPGTPLQWRWPLSSSCASLPSPMRWSCGYGAHELPPLVARTDTKMLGAPEPDAHVRRLHRLSHHSHQIIAQGIEVRLLSKGRREALKGLPRIIRTPVEATVYERLKAAP